MPPIQYRQPFLTAALLLAMAPAAVDAAPAPAGPAGLPALVQQRLGAALAQVMQSAALKQVLDEMNVEACNRMLQSLKRWFRVIFVISHVDAVKDAVDNFVEITSNGKDSRVYYE
jgi:hypothetical protein